MRVATKMVYARHNFHIKRCSIQQAGIKTVVDSLCTLSKESLHVMNAGKGETLYLSEALGRSRRVRNFSPLNLWRKDTNDYVSATGICGWHPITSSLFISPLFSLVILLLSLGLITLRYRMSIGTPNFFFPAR